MIEVTNNMMILDVWFGLVSFLDDNLLVLLKEGAL